MPSGIEITDLTVGTGAVAERNKNVVAHIRGFLHHGDEFYNTYAQGQPAHIALSRRESIAGLRNGIEGMRVGGKRELIVSPHLGYGEEGVPGKIPSNAVLRFEVELLAVREANERHPDDYPPGKQLLVTRPGEAARNLPRWQFGLREGDSAGATITYPVPGLTWRYARQKDVKLEFAPTEAAEILQSAQAILAEFPKDCLLHDDLWADASEKANSITRDRRSNTLCVTIALYEKGVVLLNYALPENSPILAGSKFYRIISRELTPYLSLDSARGNQNAPSSSPSFLP